MNVFLDAIFINIHVSFWSENDLFNYKKFKIFGNKAWHLIEINRFKFPAENARYILQQKFPKVLNIFNTYQEEYTILTENLLKSNTLYHFLEKIAPYKSLQKNIKGQTLRVLHNFIYHSIKLNFIEDLLETSLIEIKNFLDKFNIISDLSFKTKLGVLLPKNVQKVRVSNITTVIKKHYEKK